MLRSPLALALVLLALPAAAQGTFVSAQSGAWSAPATWRLASGADADGVPDADDVVTLAAGHTVTLDVSATVASLTVDSGATLAPSGNVELTAEGPVTNRGTLQPSAPYSSLWVLAKGDVANYGTWTPWGTRLVGTAPQTLTQGTDAPFQGYDFELGPEARPVAGSDLAFRADRVNLKGRTLDVGPHSIAFGAANYRTVSGDAGDGTPYGALRFAGGALHGDPANAPVLSRIRVEGTVTLTGTVRITPSNDPADVVTFSGAVSVGTAADRSAVLSAQEGCYCSAAPRFEGSLTNYGTLAQVPYSGFSLRIAGDAANYGTWTPNETVLVGSSVQTLTQGPGAPFDGPVRLEAGASARAASDLTFTGSPVVIAGGTLDLGPRTLTLGDGTRAVSLTGDPGDGAGAYGALAFSGGTLRGAPGAPPLLNRLEVEGPVTLAGTTHFAPTNAPALDYVRFTGDVVIGSLSDRSAVVAPSPGCACGPAVPQVEGDLVNYGTVANDTESPGPYRSSLSLRVDGDVTNLGAFRFNTLETGGAYRVLTGTVTELWGLRVGGPLLARGDTADAASWPVLAGYGELTVGGLDVDGLVLDGTWLVSDGGDLRRFDHVLLRNVPNDVTQVLIRHPGLPGGREFTGPGAPARRFPVRHVTFAPLYDYPGGEGSHDRGLYLAADDTAPDDGNELAIAIESGSTGGGVVDWTDRYGSPEATYYGSFLGSHVFWPAVERAALEADMARANFGAPQDPDYLALYNLTVAFPGQVVVEYDERWKPSVRLCPDGPDRPCADVEIQDGTYTVRASEGTRMQGNVEVPLKREAPAGTVPTLFALTPLGSLINWGGTLISTGGLNLIAAGGGNLISAGGLNLIGAGGGNIIGQAGSNLISTGGLNLIGAGGGNLIAAGGGNLISAGGLNLIAAGGGNLIGAGGGNLTAARSARRPLDDDSPLVEADGLLLFVGFVPEVRLDARVLLAGALGDDPAGARPLRTTLRDGGDLPAFQPYLAGAFADTPKALPDTVLASGAFLAGQPDLVDWVIVELRDGGGRAFRRAALLRADGQVVDFDSSTVAFRGLEAGDYTVAVYHRTHLTAVSAGPVTFGAGVPGAVDFTAADAAAGGSQREVAPGVFAQVSGDVDADGAVTAADLAAFAAVHGEAGYSQGDLRLDGGASARDAHDALVPALTPRPAGAPAPGALDARLVHTADPDAGTATLALEVRGAGTLGTSTFRVRYDPEAVRPIDGRALAFVGADGGSTYAYEPAEALVAPDSAVGRPAGAAALRVTLLDGPGRALPAEYAEVARVRFETLDPAADPGFGWDAVEAYDGVGGPGGAFAPGAREVVDGGYAVAEAGGPPPAALALDAPFPNPVRARAAVPFSLPAAGPARLAVYDVTGREVAALVDGRLGAGPHTATLEAGALAPGVYALRLSVGDDVVVRRVTVVR